MEEKEGNPLAVPEHSWLFDTFAGFYFCEHCGVEVGSKLFELEKDDKPDLDPQGLLDYIVDVECE